MNHQIQIGRVFTSACLLSPSLGEVHPRYPFKDPRPAFNCCSTPKVNTEQPGSQRWELWRSLWDRGLRYIEMHCGNQTYGRPTVEFVFWVGKKWNHWISFHPLISRPTRIEIKIPSCHEINPSHAFQERTPKCLRLSWWIDCACQKFRDGHLMTFAYICPQATSRGLYSFGDLTWNLHRNDPECPGHFKQVGWTWA